ncbi:hypothetical protein [Paracoccus luteus]|uniref:hypothetical protein n=1 Tax=Paracoccus luteus TaxID=2508543 RepID=UPI00107054A7|nr:hypothetical protein [Paracoccus luteus]
MERLDRSHFSDAAPAARLLSTTDYVRLLHPLGAVGKPTIMTIQGRDQAVSRVCDLAAAPFIAETCLDHSAYVSLNRFHGPRRDAHLAALNAVYLDLDVDLAPSGIASNWDMWSLQFSIETEARGLPEPSILLHTGRGMAAIWMLEPLPPQARSRWKAALGALISLYKDLGADPKCSDTTRVFRLPGTINRKSGRRVTIMEGSLRRFPFEAIEDAIYKAAGRPTRQVLNERKARRERGAGGQRAAGLSPSRRFSAVQRDLERLCEAWGGTVPEGRRNIWLHLWATCQTHQQDPGDIEARVSLTAATAVPGLTSSEVNAIARQARHQADLPMTSKPIRDGRYHYSGATIAGLLGVSDEEARVLGLEQVFSTGERKRRKADRERQRRARAGTKPRSAYLAESTISRAQPWLAAGVSRATWYRQRKAARGGAGQPSHAPDPDETNACPLQGGYALPQAQAGRQRLPAKSPFQQKSPTHPAIPEKLLMTRRRHMNSRSATQRRSTFQRTMATMAWIIPA